MSWRYDERDLTLVEGDFGKRYFVDFSDIIQNDMYFGELLSIPQQIKQNGKRISLIEFKDEEKRIFSKAAKVIEASKALKEKLSYIRAEIEYKMQTQNDPNIKQAQLIFHCFEERWLEPDNIYFNNDRVYIWRWGIRPAAIGEFVPSDTAEIKEKIYHRAQKNKSQGTTMGRKRRIGDINTFLILFTLLILLVLIIRWYSS